MIGVLGSRVGAGRAQRPGAPRRRPLVPGVLLAAVAAVFALVGAPLADSSLIAQVLNSTNTTATAGYFTCTSAVSDTTAGAAYLAYPFGELIGTSATDVSGNNRTGSYSLSGITYGVANTTVCPRDVKTVVALNGTTGAISGPNVSVNSPTVLSVEVWFRTTAAQGKLIGFGSSFTGSSINEDRHLYIDSNGKLEFGVYPNAFKTIVTPSAVTDGNWHYAVATLSSAGIALYLDGSLAASNATVTTAQSYAGYWRIGYDRLDSWPNQPASYYFKGNLAWAAVYTYALSPAQVAAHYRAGT